MLSNNDIWGILKNSFLSAGHSVMYTAKKLLIGPLTGKVTNVIRVTNSFSNQVCTVVSYIIVWSVFSGRPRNNENNGFPTSLCLSSNCILEHK